MVFDWQTGNSDVTRRAHLLPWAALYICLQNEVIFIFATSLVSDD